MAAPNPTARPRGPRGRRPLLSIEAILDAAVETLDAEGQSALTLRSLAARLDTGVGSLYHYVSGKDELLDLATDQVVGALVAGLDLPEDPFEALRRLAHATYALMQAHPWTAAYLMRDTRRQPNAMRLFERYGQQVQKLDLTTPERLDVVSSLLSFVIGVGAEMRELPQTMLEARQPQEVALREFADAWLELDAAEFPFTHEVAETFATHDDEKQFRAGVELFLDGLATRARVGPGERAQT